MNASRLILAAVALLAAGVVLAPAVFDHVEPFDISDPGSEVERAYAAYEQQTGQRAEPEVLLLVEPRGAVEGEAGTAAVARAAAQLQNVPGIAAVKEPDSNPELISEDGSTALLLGYLDADVNRVDVGESVVHAFSGDSGVLAGGTAVAAHQLSAGSDEDARQIELYAAPVLLLLSLWIFRTAIAAALPLLVGLFSIVLTFALLRLVATVTVIDLFSLQVVTGLGVGLAIDYSLFVVSRYRREVAAGGDYEAALTKTLATAGRTVLFSSLTVAAAMATLIVFPQQFLRSTGIAGALVALLSGGAALLVLPAVLTTLGPRVGAPRRRGGPDSRPDIWERLARAAVNRPLPTGGIGLLIMLAIAAPSISADLTTPDARELPADESAAKVADAAATRFPGVPGTRLFALVPPAAPAAAIAAASHRVQEDSSVLSVGDPERLDGGARQVVVLADVDPLSDRGQDLVAAVRASGWPDGTLIGGRAAELSDQRSSIGDHAVIVAALVIATTAALILLMTGSVILPLLALVMNGLAVAASLGVTVAIFTTKPLAEALGATAQDAIDISVPVLAFAVVFGLSTDYGIFLLARIAETRAGGDRSPRAIAGAVASTSRLISASALLFCVAVGAFTFSDLVIIKEFSIAISVAVLLDATIIRAVLLPATLGLLGERAWWRPGRSRPG